MLFSSRYVHCIHEVDFLFLFFSTEEEIDGQSLLGKTEGDICSFFEKAGPRTKFRYILHSYKVHRRFDITVYESL